MMKKHNRRFSRVLGLVLAFAMMMSVGSVYAGDGENIHVYTYPDGSTVNFFLDENNMPYIYENGVKTFIALSLPHLEVTDGAKLEQLNAEMSNIKVRGVPTNYIDLSTGSPTLASSTYSARVDYSNINAFVTPVFKLNKSHATIIIGQSVSGFHLHGQKFDVYYYYYDAIEDRWFTVFQSFRQCCTLTNIQHSPSVYEYGQVDVTKRALVNNVDITVHTTPLW